MRREKSPASMRVVLALLVALSAVVLSSCGKYPPQSTTAPKGSAQSGRGGRASSAAAPTQAQTREAADVANLREMFNSRLKSGKMDDVIRVAEKLAKEYPRNAEAKYILAYSLQRVGQRQSEALELYDEAEALGFSQYWVDYNRGLLYFTMGQKDKARQDLDRALALAPDPKLREGLQEFIKANLK